MATRTIVAPRDAGTNGGSDPTAPVCHQPATADIPQPAGLTLPSIPQPDGTIDGIMAALEALIQGYNMLGGIQPGGPGSPQGQAKQGDRFTETGRKKKKIHVTNPDDDSQFVDVEVVSELTLTDKVTGEIWFWKL